MHGNDTNLKNGCFGMQRTDASACKERMLRRLNFGMRRPNYGCLAKYMARALASKGHWAVKGTAWENGCFAATVLICPEAILF
jgi:hypothetical protein